MMFSYAIFMMMLCYIRQCSVINGWAVVLIFLCACCVNQIPLFDPKYKILIVTTFELYLLQHKC